MQLKRLIEGSNVAYGTNQSFEVLDTKKTAGDAFFPQRASLIIASTQQNSQ